MNNANTTYDEKGPLRVLRLKEVMSLTGYSEAHIYRLMNSGEFPPRFKLRRGGRAVGWSSHDVHDWIVSRMEQGRQ